jgi:hypothetical protein
LRDAGCVTQSWIDRIQSVVPGTGQRIWWNGLWMQKAPGVSLRQLAAATLPHLVTSFQVDILQASPALVACYASGACSLMHLLTSFQVDILQASPALVACYARNTRYFWLQQGIKSRSYHATLDRPGAQS